MSLLTVVIAGYFVVLTMYYTAIVRFFGIEVFVAVHCIFVNGRNGHPLNCVFARVFVNYWAFFSLCCIRFIITARF